MNKIKILGTIGGVMAVLGAAMQFLTDDKIQRAEIEEAVKKELKERDEKTAEEQ